MVDMTYVKLHSLHPFARHIMLAYDVAGEVGSYDDGEYFGDLTLKNVLETNQLKNVALFMFHVAGNQQIGAQCFDVIRMLADELVTQLENQTDKRTCEEIDNSLIQPPRVSRNPDWVVQEQQQENWDDPDQTSLKSVNVEMTPTEEW